MEPLDRSPQSTRSDRLRPWLAGSLAVLAVFTMGAAKPAPVKSQAPRAAAKVKAPARKPVERPMPVIQSISWRPFGLVVKASAPLNPEIFMLEKPHRFVVDLPIAEFAEPHLAQTIPIDDGLVKQVRVAKQDSGAVRIVVDCLKSPGLQLVQLGDRSTFVLALAGQSHKELAALLREASTYAGAGQAIEQMWARETATELKLHLRADDKLTYSLSEPEPGKLALKIPQGRFGSVLPRPGKHLEKLSVKKGADKTWTLEVDLKDAMYQLEEAVSQDKTGLTLTWTKVEARRFANRPVVVIDPGHGGADPGALGPNGVAEKKVCLEQALALQKALWRKRINAVLTRSADIDLLLEPRLAMIDKLKADLFISLHANSHTTPDSHGTETYFRNPHSQHFAATIQEQITALMNRPNRGIKQERLFVIRHAKVPSILVETGFISNPHEERLLDAPAFQLEAAAAMTAGVERYLAGVPPLSLESLKDTTGALGNPHGADTM